ncbi:hypothetical protein DITRI_Ditri13aG0087900 [Diplodiscus trichospermus]
MAILPNPCSIKLLQPNNGNPFSTPSFVSIGTGRHQPHQIAVISTLKTSYQTKSLDRFINDNNHVLPESSARRGPLLEDQILTTREVGENEGKSGYSTSKLKTKQKDEEALVKDVENIISRLKAVVERVRELEIEKLMGRFKGTMSEEDRLLVESTSKEIVDKFLQRPFQYLKSVNGDFEEKLKDLNLLTLMLEKSCLECQR